MMCPECGKPTVTMYDYDSCQFCGWRGRLQTNVETTQPEICPSCGRPTVVQFGARTCQYCGWRGDRQPIDHLSIREQVRIELEQCERIRKERENHEISKSLDLDCDGGACRGL
jgi:hypothetical protein